MRKMILKHPSDEKSYEVLDMLGDEFSMLFPGRASELYEVRPNGEPSLVTRREIPDDLIICDVCSALIKNDERVVVVGGCMGIHPQGRAYCDRCFKRNLERYCREEDS